MKKQSYILLIILALIIIILEFDSGLSRPIISFVRSATLSLETSLSSTSHRVAKNLDFMTGINRVRRQNDELTTKMTELEVDKSQIAELTQENALLKKELGFLDASEKGTLVAARIIERDPTNFLDYIVIDKGSKDGIAEKMPVTSNGVLVGQVKEVYDATAKVILVTSKDSIIQAMLQDSRATGILRGGISGLYLDNILSDVNFKAGEFVVTSGLGGTMKQGILIGRAEEVQSGGSEIFKSINIEPSADLSKLELVFVQIK